MINSKTTLAQTLVSLFFLIGLTAQAQSLKVGFTRIDYIVTQSPEAKEVTNQLNIQQTQAENELKRMQTELQTKYSAYQSGAAQMTDVIRKDRETELQTLQTRIQQFSQTAQESLQAKYGQLMKPILTKIQQAIDTVALQNGYHYIINATSNSNVLYAAEELNITDLVLKKMGITPGQNTDKPANAPAPTTPKAATPPRKK
ncbi:OmpH/Skp family outer membrane protein [Spirosoma gilvum]